MADKYFDKGCYKRVDDVVIPFNLPTIWTRRTHEYFPPAFKQEVRTLLLVALRLGFYKDFVFLIIEQLARDYNLERAAKQCSWTVPNPWIPGPAPMIPRSGFAHLWMG